MLLYNNVSIANCVYRIADTLNSKYYRKDTKDILFAPILQGAVPFFHDVSKEILFDPYVDYVGISSYQGTKQGEFNLYKDLNPELVKDKIVWFFDDIADTGRTLQFLTDQALSYGAAEVHSCVLIKRLGSPYKVDLFGFETAKWVWGYGMDAPNGKGRTFDSVYCND